LINQDQTKPIFDMGKSYATNVMSDSYQAFTPEQQQKMIADQTKQAEEGFKQTRNAVGSRLANQGLAGSGVSAMDWGGQAANENKAIADIVSNVANQNIAATRADKSQAVGMLPSLASISQIPLQNQMTYTGILGTDQAAKNAWNQWNKEMEQQAKAASIGAYQNWYNQKSNEASQNRNAMGGFLGGLFGK
jgi:hypothetical protein